MSTDQLVADISRASAAYLWNLIKAIAALPAEEGYERLERHFAAALAAYRRETEDRPLPQPSRN